MREPGAGEKSPRFSRRQLATMTSIGALAGGVWTVGLASVLRSAEPDITILGTGDWQVVFLESGTDRILFLVGTFDSSPEGAISQLLSTLRQHVDLVVATSSAIAQLDRSGQLGRAVWIQLDAEPTQPDSLRLRALRQRLVISVQGGSVDMRRIPQREWSRQEQLPASWIVELQLGGLRLALANSLLMAASTASPETALLIAPGGNIDAALNLLPNVSIATNGYGFEPLLEPVAKSDGYLVRTFPRDSARFRFNDGVLSLPSWAQPIADLTA